MIRKRERNDSNSCFTQRSFELKTDNDQHTNRKGYINNKKMQRKNKINIFQCFQ